MNRNDGLTEAEQPFSMMAGAGGVVCWKRSPGVGGLAMVVAVISWSCADSGIASVGALVHVTSGLTIDGKASGSSGAGVLLAGYAVGNMR